MIKSTQSKITPCLWFDKQADEAVNYYTSIFPNSKILKTLYYGEAGPMPEGTVLTITFLLNGNEFMALNGGPHFDFNPAVSFIVHCEDQKEVDFYWDKLSSDKSAEQCGWLKDKFGLSWQIVPVVLEEMITDSDPVKVNKVMEALMEMKKLDIKLLEEAYNK